VGRELVQVAFTAAQTKSAGEASATAPAAPGDAPVETRLADAPVSLPPEPRSATRGMPAAVLPWLGAVTLAVLYLLAKTFF
jgi:hypothetical protein